MAARIETLEETRLAIQAEVDSSKEQADRNKMGQFATPTDLAIDLLKYASWQSHETDKIRFLDPAIGTGSFFSALVKVFPRSQIEKAAGYEIDHAYGVPASNLWQDEGLDVILGDFTKAVPPGPDQKFNLVICNPPYVRHHHLIDGEKRRLKSLMRKSCGMELSGLAGLYCYFLGLAHSWMEDGALAGWLIPSEFMDVNYGAAVRRYLLEEVNLLHIHRFDPNDVQFADALVSSAIVWFRKDTKPRGDDVRFTYGGSLRNPKIERFIPVDTLREKAKWTRYPQNGVAKIANEFVLSDFFRVTRGLATGDNKFFILSREDIESHELPMREFKPILPSPRYLECDEIEADKEGNPTKIRSLFLLDCDLEESEIQAKYPKLWSYLQSGAKASVSERYLCRHRKPWYSQENRPPSPFMCTYLGRSDKKNGKPFRFILNHSNATATNVYLILYPNDAVKIALSKDPSLKRKIWQLLSDISPTSMLEEGRVYGGGLHKMEPKELGNVDAGAIAKLLQEFVSINRRPQNDLFENNEKPQEVSASAG